MVITTEQLEERFKACMIRVSDTLFEYIGEAIERKILSGFLINIVHGVIPEIQEYLNRKTGKELIEGFIYCSRSNDDVGENSKMKERMYPEYWDIFVELPTPEEYQKDKQDPENAEPIPKDAELFFLEKLPVIFPIVEPFKDVIRTLYEFEDKQGTPFLSIVEKKYIAHIFRAFPVLAIKYIIHKRQPKIVNGQLAVGETGKIQYYYSGEVYEADISGKKSMERFGLTNEDIVK